MNSEIKRQEPEVIITLSVEEAQFLWGLVQNPHPTDAPEAREFQKTLFNTLTPVLNSVGVR